MITSITLENFRSLKHLEMPELSQITLLTGKNNAGKSSILEGLFLFLAHKDSQSFSKLNALRGLPTILHPSSLWEPAFNGMNTNNILRIAAVIDGSACDLRYIRENSVILVDVSGATQKEFSQTTSSTKSIYTMKFHFNQGDYSEDGLFSINDKGLVTHLKTNVNLNGDLFPSLPSAVYINGKIKEDKPLLDWVGQMELKGEKQNCLEALKHIEPEITDILTISNQGQIQVYAKIREQLLPAKLAGDGVNQLLYILVAITANPDSVMLIDEIDTGFHYSMLETLWSAVATAAKNSRCQVIATTHSYECIDHAVDGIGQANMLDSFCLYRIDRSTERHRAVRYSGNLVKEAIASSMEVR